MRLAGTYVDLDDALDGLLCIALAVLIIQWSTSSSKSTGAYTAVSQGDGPVLLTDRSLERLEDGGTIDVDRWHGGTLTIEGYQTVDVDGGEAGG